MDSNGIVVYRIGPQAGRAKPDSTTRAMTQFILIFRHCHVASTM